MTISKIIIICSVFLIVLMLTALVFIILILLRKKKIQQFLALHEKWSKFIRNSGNDRVTTITRFKALSDDKKEYESKLNALKELHKKMNSLINDLNNDFKDWKSALTKYNLKDAQRIYLKIKPRYEKYATSWSSFLNISDELNLYWNTIDTVVANSFKWLKLIAEYVENKKTKFVHSYASITDELSKLKEQTIKFENEKMQEKIKDVSLKLNEHEKRIKVFAKKVDHLMAIEWSLYNYLPELINELKELDSNNSNILEIQTSYKDIVEKFLSASYLETVEKIKDLYFHIYIVKLKIKNKKAFQNFLELNINKYQKLFVEIEKTLNEQIFPIKDDNDKKQIGLFFEFKNLKEEFKNLFLKVTNNELAKIDYLETSILLKNIIEYLDKLNEWITIYNNMNDKKIFDSYYSAVNQIWYLKLLESQNILDSGIENQNDFDALSKLNIYRNREIEKTSHINTNNKIWLDWHKQLIKLFVKVYEAKLYKKMTERLIMGLAKYRRDNDELNELLLSVNGKLIAKQYKEAFEFLINVIEKGKKYVL